MTSSLEEYVKYYIKQRGRGLFSKGDHLAFLERAINYIDKKLNNKPFTVEYVVDSRYHGADELATTIATILQGISVGVSKDRLSLVKAKLLLMKEFALCGAVTIEMTDMFGEKIDAYPVGVFNVNKNYLGIANSGDEFKELWNADADNKQLGSIVIPATEPSFIFLPNEGVEPPVITGLKYFDVIYDINAPTLYLPTDAYVAYDDSLVTKDTNTYATVANAAMFFISGWNNMEITPTTGKQVALTDYIARKVIHVFHNDKGNVFTSNLYQPLMRISGRLPKGLVAYAPHYRNTTVDVVSNWHELKELQHWASNGVGGGVWGINLNVYPKAGFPNLRTVFYAELTSSTYDGTPGSYFLKGQRVIKPYINKKETPLLKNLYIRFNSTGAVNGWLRSEYDAEFWENLPPIYNEIRIDNIASLSPELVDVIYNQLAITLANVTPNGNRKRLQIYANKATSASADARAFLMSKGWVIA